MDLKSKIKDDCRGQSALQTDVSIHRSLPGNTSGPLRQWTTTSNHQLRPFRSANQSVPLKKSSNDRKRPIHQLRLPAFLSLKEPATTIVNVLLPRFEMANRYCLNGNNRFLSVEGTGESLRVLIFEEGADKENSNVHTKAMGAVFTHHGRDRRKCEESIGATDERDVSKSYRRKVVCIDKCGLQMCGHPTVLLAPREGTSAIKVWDSSSTTRMDMPNRNHFTHKSTTSGTDKSRAVLDRPLQSGIVFIF
jgi:hypothetical protein